MNLLINDRVTDILCVSDTWLPPEIRDEHIAIPNYISYRCDVGRGGGVCIYVRDVFRVTPVNTNIVKDERCRRRVGGGTEQQVTHCDNRLPLSSS